MLRQPGPRVLTTTLESRVRGNWDKRWRGGCVRCGVIGSRSAYGGRGGGSQVSLSIRRTLMPTAQSPSCIRNRRLHFHPSKPTLYSRRVNRTSSCGTACTRRMTGHRDRINALWLVWDRMKFTNLIRKIHQVSKKFSLIAQAAILGACYVKAISDLPTSPVSLAW